MNYFPNEGLFITDPVMAIFTVFLTTLLVWRYPEANLALLTVAAHFVSKTHVNIPWLSATLSMIYPMTTVFLIRLAVLTKKDIISKREPFDPLVVGMAIFSTLIVLNYIIQPKEPYNNGVGVVRLHFVLNVIPFVGLIIIGRNNIRLQRTIKRMFAVLVIIQAIFIIGVTNELLFGASISDLKFYRIYGIPLFDIRSELATIFALAFLMIKTRRQHQLIYLSLIVSSLSLIIISAGRVALISVIFAWLLVLYSIGKLKNIWQPVTFLAMLFIFFSTDFVRHKIDYDISTSVNEFLTIQYDRTATSVVPTDFSSGRIEIWSHALNSFLRSPLLGVGSGNATGVIEYFRPDGSVGLTRAGVHNYFLQILAENGVIGLFVFVFMLARMISLAFQTKATIILSPELQRLRIIGIAILFLSIIQAMTGYFAFGFWASALLLVIYQRSKLMQNAAQGSRKPALAIRT